MITGYLIESIAENHGAGRIVYASRVQSMPRCIAQGHSFEDAERSLARAFPVYVDSRRARGVEVPSPDLPGVMSASVRTWVGFEGGTQG